MKKFTNTVIFFLLVSLIAKADKVGVEFAKQIAKNHYYNQVADISYDNINLSLCFTELRNDQAMYYIFDVDDQNGFVIISADNDVYPILGYSFKSNFSDYMNNLPPNFSEWMNSYADQIEFVINNSIKADEITQDKWKKLENIKQTTKSTDDVSPLISTNWDQGQYYNEFCPIDASGPDGHALVGCVATTMGQIMKYHNHPVQGTGSHSYYCYPYGTLSANFGATIYNWSSMPNQLYGYNTAVATLLYHCGVSVDMDYGPDASGAYSYDAREALINFFSYSADASLLYKYSYSNTTWETMLRNQLDASQPLFYQGVGPDGGHAWVCDGYQGTSYFHFNWGWSGYANGYFYLNNLNPGGLTFNDDQGAIFDIYPNVTITLDPPTNFVAEVIATNDVNLQWDPPAGGGTEEELIYDDGTSTGAYSYEGYTMATQMSPAGPCKVLMMKFYTTTQAGANDFNATMFEWVGSQPGTDIIYEENVIAINEDWLEVDIAAQNITFDGDFVVGFGSVNATTFLGYDAGLNNGRSWDFDNTGMTWASWSEAYLIRAIVEYTDGTVAEIGTGTSTPVILKSANNTIHPTDYSGVTTVKPIANQASQTKDLLGYNVYSDDAGLVGYTTESFYLDEDLEPGNYTYWATAVYDEGESDPSNTDEVTIEGGAVEPPLDFDATVQETDDVYCTWDPPVVGGTEEELIYDDGVSTGAYSYNGYTMSTQMSPAGPCQVLKMKFYTTTQAGDNDFNATIFDWIGSQPGTDIIYEENVIAVNEDWLEVDITAQNITFDGDFVVGFGSVNATTFLGYDAALNNGRSWDFDNAGMTWASWGETYLIRAVVEYTDGTVAEIGTGTSTPVLLKSAKNSVHPTDYSGVSIVKPIENQSGQAKDLLGYNVYRDGSLVGNTTETFLLEEDLDPGTYTYWATAVYDEGESDPSNTDEVTIETIVIEPPENLIATVDDCVVLLTWELAGESKNLLGFNIYRDGTLLDFITEGTYFTVLEPCSSYEFFVTAVYDEGESDPSNTVLVSIPCYPPENFGAIVYEINNVHLECDPPVCGTPLSYNFYRNDSLIENSTDPEYDDLDLSPGTYTFYATAVWTEDESEPSNTVTITTTLSPPTDLTAMDDFEQNIELNWTAPGAGGEVEELIYDNGVSTGTYSYSGYTMGTQMSPAGPCQVLKMKFYTTTQAGDNDFNATMFEWEGSLPGTDIIYEKNVIALNEEWLEVDIAAQNITFDGDFLVGFGSVNTTTFLGYDASLNNGRSWDFDNTGLTWASWTEAYLIRAIVEYTDGTVAEIGAGTTAPVILKSANNSVHPSNYTGVNTVKPIDNLASQSKDLIGYNVYYMFNSGSFDMIAEEVLETNHTHLDAAISGLHTYYVTAIYDEGESVPSNEDFVLIASIEDQAFSSTAVYPNPASNAVNIKSDFAINSVIIYKHSGQVISNEQINTKLYQINTSQYTPGLYFFQIETSEGRISKRIIIQ